MALNGTYENKKTRRLARSLQMPPWAALGLMEAIWAWARKAAKTGRIDTSQWEDLAEYLHWQSTLDGLRSMLIGAGFVDEMGGWDWIHDWDHHADDSVRKALEYAKESFANGSEPRQWKKRSSPQVPQNGDFREIEKKLPTPGDGPELWPKTTKVPQNQEKVHEKPEIVRATTRAQPEPEPEPEPAAKRALPAREPPPLSTEGHPEFEAYRGALCSFMSPETPPPDDAMVAKIIWAARGATVEQLVAKFRDFAKTRRDPPKSYGFWPDVIAGWFNTPKRSRSG